VGERLHLGLVGEAVLVVGGHLRGLGLGFRIIKGF
jgi:hypothetical protein